MAWVTNRPLELIEAVADLDDSVVGGVRSIALLGNGNEICDLVVRWKGMGP